MPAFRKRKKLEWKSPVKKLGETALGRGAIAAGLALFYDVRGNQYGIYAGQGKRPIGVVLAKETTDFVANHHTCKAR
jgi:hypothetical protein